MSSGMDKIDALYSGYGDMAPWGKGPAQGQLRNKGKTYIREQFPKLDYIRTCKVKGDEEPKYQVLGGLGLPPLGEKRAADTLVGNGRRPEFAPSALESSLSSLLVPAAIVVMFLSLFGLLMIFTRKGKGQKRTSAANGRSRKEDSYSLETDIDKTI